MASKGFKDLRRKAGNIPLYHKTHLAKPRHYSTAEPQSFSEQFPQTTIAAPLIHSFNAQSQYANPGALALGLSTEPEVITAAIEQARQSDPKYVDRQHQIFRSLEEQDFFQSTAMAHELEIRQMQQPIEPDENDEHFGLAWEHDSYEGRYAFQAQ